jgi:outer membrane protein assembly factor BamB
MLNNLILLLIFTACSGLKVTAPEKENKVFTVKWSKNLDPDYETGNFPLTVGGTVVTDDYVAVGSLGGNFYVYDQENGRELWKSKEKKSVNGTPLFFDDHFYYGTQSGRLVVRHSITGKLKYAIDLGSPIESKPVIQEGRLYIYLRGHQIVSLDAETGKMLWSYRRAIAIPTTLQRTTKPLIIGNKIIVGFADGYLGALSRDEGVILWETKLAENAKFVDVDLNPLKVGQFVLTGSPASDLFLIDPENGTIKQTFSFRVMSHPIEKNGLITIGTVDGSVVLMNIKGDVIRTKQIAKDGINNIVFWKNLLIASSFDGTIYALDPVELTVVEKFNLGSKQSAIFSELDTHHDLSFLTSRNRLFVIK